MKLVSILPVEESTGKVEVIDGSGACPTEDCGSMFHWAQLLHKLRSGVPSQKREALDKIDRSMNYTGKGATANGTFNPDRFDVEKAKAAVMDALSLPGSFRQGARIFSRPTAPGGPTKADLRGQAPKKKEHVMSTDMGDGTFMEESSTSKRDGVHSRACSNCGTPHGLSL